MKNLLGFSKESLRALIQSLHHPAFHAQTIFKHLHQGHNWMQIKSIPSQLKENLHNGGYHVDRGTLKHEAISKDGTRRCLIELAGSTVECVFIPEQDRMTVCVSSQVGCSLSCSFCHTGTQRLERNLTAADIIAQIDQQNSGGRLNVVFMGQGEPLLNWRGVSEACRVMFDRGMHPERITISTSGIATVIPRVAQLGVHLAISLHAPTDALRTRLMPINRTYPLAALLEACRQYQRTVNPDLRRITFEYVMLDSVNDDIYQHPRQLVELLQGIPSLINLIPFNPWPGSLFKPSPMDRVEAFSRALQAFGVHATIRRPRGQDIMAACGQLKACN